MIVLNGASSSGKSSPAQRLQETLEIPFLLLSGDQLIEARCLPGRRDTEGAFAWLGQMQPRFFDGFHRRVPVMAAAGNDVIVKHVVEFARWRAQLDDLLGDFDVFWVVVHCDLDEIDRNEAARGGRAHVEQHHIHDHGPYDLHVDTTAGVTDALVQVVIDAWDGRRGHGAGPAVLS